MSLTLNSRHILACLKLILPYLFWLRHIQNPSLFRIILLLPYSGKSLFRTPAYLGTLCFWHIHRYSRYVLADSGIFRFLAQTYSCILKHILTHGLFSHIQKPLTVSDTTQEQFMHILNLDWTDSDIFRTLTYLGTKCFTHIQAYSLIYTYRGIIAYIEIKTYSGSWHYP